MQIRLIYHDRARDLVGKSGDMLFLDETATGASLLSRLTAAHPNVMGKTQTFHLLRNGREINADTELADGDILEVTVRGISA